LKNIKQKVGQQGQITNKGKRLSVILALRENEKPHVVTDHSSRHLIYLKHSFERAVKKRDVSVIEEKREQHEPCLKLPRGKERRNKKPHEEFSDYPQTLF
jgi:hypothetical protein